MLRYNLRVVECRLAAAALAKGLGLSTSDATAINTLKEVEPLIINKYGPGIDAQTQAVKEHLHEGTYSQDEVSRGDDVKGVVEQALRLVHHYLCGVG